MRYIKKNTNSPAVKLLNEWRQMRLSASQSLLYNDFDKKAKLNEILREEQGFICCYCQQRINHFQGNNEGGSHNEHFIPENGEFGRVDLQIDYYNLYGCCNYSNGREEDKQYCGEAKHDKKINVCFLKKINCSSYFKYNTIGEIMPQCLFGSMMECKKNRLSLTQDQVDALEMIEVLNLNQQSLVEERRKDLSVLFRYMDGHTKGQIETKIQQWNTTLPYIRFVDMLLYFMKMKKNK